MTIAREQARFAALQAKTDRQLLVLAERRLEAGLRAARPRFYTEDPDFTTANAALADVLRWRPAVRVLSDRVRLDSKLQELEQALTDALEGCVAAAVVS